MIEFKGQQITAKQYLKKYAKLELLITAMENQLDRLYAKAMKCTSDISPNSSRGGASDRVGNNIVKMEYLKELLQETKETYTDIKTDIIKTINDMPDYDERLLLIYRYCEDLDFRIIARKMCYSESALFYNHGKALRSFEKVRSKL